MCTAAQRPPVEETEGYLAALLERFGPDFYTVLFGEKGSKGLKGMGGVHKVAVAFSDSPNAEFFAKQLGLDGSELTQMKKVMKSVIEGNPAAGLTEEQAIDLQFYMEKLQETQFFK